MGLDITPHTRTSSENAGLDALSATNPFYAATTLSEPAIGSGIETCETGA